MTPDGLPSRPTAPSDDRAVSEVLGSILIFGLLVAVLVVFQATAVPNENQQIEYEHSKRVSADLLEFDEEVAAVAATGRERTATVEMGVRYPARMFLLNPGPAPGTLRMEPADVTVRNAAATGETGDYWDGTDRTFDSRRVVYEADYNVYRNDPRTVYEHGVLAEQYDAETVQADEGAFVDGRRVSLVALAGERSTSQVDTLAVEVDPTSASTRTVPVEADGGPITVTVETALSAAEWRSFLEDERTANGGRVASVAAGSEPGTVDVVLEEGVTYELVLAEVGVGPDVTRAGPHYLTTVGQARVATGRGEPVDLAVEVRDRFNAPLSGASVAFSASGGTLSTTSAVTDDEGRATVTFTPTGTGGTVTASADLDGSGTVEERERVTFTVTAPAAPGSGETVDPGDTLRAINPRQGAVFLRNASVSGTTVTATFENADSGSWNLTEGRISFVFSPNDPTSATVTWADPSPDAQLATLPVSGDFETFSPPVEVPAGGTATVRFEFDRRLQSPSNRSPFDSFVVFSARHERATGERRYQTYFVSETAGGSVGDGPGDEPGDGDGATQASAVTYDGDAVAAGPGGSGSGVQFGLTNGGSQAAAITHVRITTDAEDVDKLEERRGGSGAFDRVVFVDASTDGYYEGNDALGRTVELDEPAVLEPGTSATVSLYEFLGGCNPGGQQCESADVADERVTVEVTFGDGSTATYAFRVG